MKNELNYIVKIKNGKPVIYGTAGKENDGAPVYVFQEKEAFDAALAEGLIPVGALIVKTYDEIEMAGGPFDDALSDESENAVQNKIISAEVERLDQSIADALALRASLTGFGLGKVCPVGLTDATEANGLLLGAFEKNASIEGSISNEIKENTENIQKIPAQIKSNLYMDSFTAEPQKPWTALKNNWEKFPADSSFVIRIDASWAFSAIVFKLDEGYGSALIQGYMGNYMCRVFNGEWQYQNMQGGEVIKF